MGPVPPLALEVFFHSGQELFLADRPAGKRTPCTASASDAGLLRSSSSSRQRAAPPFSDHNSKSRMPSLLSPDKCGAALDHALRIAAVDAADSAVREVRAEQVEVHLAALAGVKGRLAIGTARGEVIGKFRLDAACVSRHERR